VKKNFSPYHHTDALPSPIEQQNDTSMTSSQNKKKKRKWSPPRKYDEYSITKKEAMIMKIDLTNMMRKVHGMTIQDFKDSLTDMLNHTKTTTKILEPQIHKYDTACR
jgi:hypothetical protein